MHVFTAESDPAAVRRAVEAGEHFWLDVPRDRLDTDHPAARALGIDDETLRRADHSGVFVEAQQSTIVFPGAHRADRRVDRVAVTIVAGEAGIVTLRDHDCGELDDLRGSARDVDALKVLEALTDSVQAAADHLEDEVEDAENRMLRTRARQQLADVTALRQQVSQLVKIAREQRGTVIRNQDELADVPVRRGTGAVRVRELEGRVARATDAAESTRQTIAEALNLYLSFAAENLTRIATVLLPLTVVSGFFGMNFGWMVDHIDTLWSFVAFGIGGMVVAVAGVRLYLGRKGYT